jgi:peptide chain release factor 2
MRAEGQAHIDRIEAALALVRKFLDWERALRRLDELNARVEDPTLWDNPKEAQAVMRERRRLEAAIGTVQTIDQEMADAVEFIELGEAEGAVRLSKRESRPWRLWPIVPMPTRSRRCSPVRPTPTTLI